MNGSPAVKKSWRERIFYTPEITDQGRMRAVANNVILHLHPTQAPAQAIRFTYTWGLGGISVILALISGLTGALLMFRYEANVERAYLSIQMLETQVAFGALVRGLHHWSANLLVITTFLHLLRVFFTGGYKKKRFTNWLVGIALLVIVLAFNFTGYLLPWDQLAYWAITVSTSLIGYIPIIGTELSRMVLGGPQVGQAALSNFYAIHVAALPALMAAMLSYHFWKVRKDGGISQPEHAEGKPVERVTTIPHLVRKELAVAVVIVTAVVLWAMWIPAPLKELADPTHSPNPAKASWYFVGLQELLLHMHPQAALALVSIVLLSLALLPRWDRQDGNIGVYFRSRVGQKTALLGAILAVYLTPLLVAADEYWVDLAATFPTWPAAVTGGWLPLALALVGLALIYGLARLILRANHSEGLVGLVTFVMVSLIVLTVIGNLFRGPNMALVLPF
jgi:quinol-cytochrome oxidoreductase complex cytochrome b subunit